MALTKAEKRKITEEEAYRAKVREEHQFRLQVAKPKKQGTNVLGCLLVIIVIPILLVITLMAINPAGQFEKAEKQALLTSITPLPAADLANKTEEDIKTDFEAIYTNYSDTGLTPSRKVKITGFDIENANIQVDYNVNTGTPIYVGYSFDAKPLPEEVAWKITGREKPTSYANTNSGVQNRTVYVWEDLTEILPYKMIQAIYEADGKLAGISFSMENLQTAKSSDSLYYTQ